MVDILVEEAFIARLELDAKNSNNLIKKNLYKEKINMDKSSFENNDLDEFISDNGMTYKKIIQNN